MVFNGDVQGQDLMSDMDFWCSTDDQTYPLQDKVRNFVFGLAKTSSRIMRSDRRWKHSSSNLSTIAIATQPIAAGEDNVTLDTKHLKILRVRILGKDGKYTTLKPVDRNSASDDLLNATGEPTSYDKIGFSILPLPVPDYATTIQIEYQPGHAVDIPTIASLDWEVGFNRDFERLPVLYGARPYCALYARDRLNAIDTEIMAIEAAMDDFYESRDLDDEPEFVVQRTSRGPSLLL